jgi:hypothetical protein
VIDVDDMVAAEWAFGVDVEPAANAFGVEVVFIGTGKHNHFFALHILLHADATLIRSCCCDGNVTLREIVDIGLLVQNGIDFPLL